MPIPPQVKLVLFALLASALVVGGWKINQWRTDAAGRKDAEHALSAARTAWAAQHKKDTDTARADNKAATDLSGELTNLRGQVSDLHARIAAAHLTRPDPTSSPGAPANATACPHAGLSADFRLLYNEAFGVPIPRPAVPGG